MDKATKTRKYKKMKIKEKEIRAVLKKLELIGYPPMKDKEKEFRMILDDLLVIGWDKYDTRKGRENELLIAETLFRLPKEVRKKVLKKVLFIVSPNNLSGMCIGGVKEQDIIVLNFDNFKEEREKTYTITHEIAHFILGYNVNTKSIRNIEAQEKRQEKEAEQLVDKWCL